MVIRMVQPTMVDGGTWQSEDVFEIRTDNLESVLAWSRKQVDELAPARVVVAVVHPTHDDRGGPMHTRPPLCSTRLVAMDSA